MKTTYLFIFLITSLNITAQTESATAFKKCNTIAINTEKGGLSLEQFTMFLQDNGYAVETDGNTSSIKTAPFAIKKWMNTSGTINAFFRFETGNSMVVVTASRSTTQFGATNVRKMAMGGSVEGDLFEIVNQLCRQFVSENGYTISYSIE